LKQFEEISSSNKNLNQINQTGILVFEDGTSFFGNGIGYEGSAVGEVCFNTSITGYQEIITDPSYSDQIINFTFPHVGNVGTNPEDNEADKAWVKGVIFNSNVTEPSNYRSIKKLDKWLKKRKIVGIVGLDTRVITNYIRDKGAPKGTIQFSRKSKHDLVELLNKSKSWNGLLGLDLAKKVSCKKIYHWSSLKSWDKKKGYTKNKKNKYKIVAIDYGIKKNILRCFSDINCSITVVPAKYSAEKIVKLNPDGVFLSNGPGDPAATGKYAIPVIKKLITNKIPIFGICLGHQLLSLALGAKTKKMSLGHRGANHPVKDLSTSKVEITSQNHGFEIDPKSIPGSVKVTHKSLFDGCIEGIEVKKKKVFSVQYHPEASPGPQDSKYLFNKFLKNIIASKKNGKKKRY
jgi:carbamoyl-phosphate synthase small subunit|tara:strand:- start:148 stop:1359 length:1212 start_codon:yes stop_codon:yes gene_type:complete